VKRTLMQVYVKNSAEAVETYMRAFDGRINCDYRDEKGCCYHTEIDVYGQIIALSEAPEGTVSGNAMQFCLHFAPEETDKVVKAYDVLKNDAEIICPLGRCDYAETMFSLVDRFGIYWCVFD